MTDAETGLVAAIETEARNWFGPFVDNPKNSGPGWARLFAHHAVDQWRIKMGRQQMTEIDPRGHHLDTTALRCTECTMTVHEIDRHPDLSCDVAGRAKLPPNAAPDTAAYMLRRETLGRLAGA